MFTVGREDSQTSQEVMEVTDGARMAGCSSNTIEGWMGWTKGGTGRIPRAPIDAVKNVMRGVYRSLSLANEARSLTG